MRPCVHFEVHKLPSVILLGWLGSIVVFELRVLVRPDKIDLRPVWKIQTKCFAIQKCFFQIQTFRFFQRHASHVETTVHGRILQATSHRLVEEWNPISTPFARPYLGRAGVPDALHSRVAGYSSFHRTHQIHWSSLPSAEQCFQFVHTAAFKFFSISSVISSQHVANSRTGSRGCHTLGPP